MKLASRIMALFPPSSARTPWYSTGCGVARQPPDSTRVAGIPPSSCVRPTAVHLFQHDQHAAGGLGVPAWHAGVGPSGARSARVRCGRRCGVVLQVGGQAFVGFGDAPEPIDGPRIGVVAVGVVLAGESAVGLLDTG